jgi:polyhydroxyalkanoate synthesis regulator protein
MINSTTSTYLTLHVLFVFKEKADFIIYDMSKSEKQILHNTQREILVSQIGEESAGGDDAGAGVFGESQC